jgi:AraC family transcriptional regulator
MTTVMKDGQFVGATAASRLVAGITLAETTYRGGLVVPAHAHGTTLVTLVLDGALTEQRGRRSVHCDPGTLIVHPQEEPHAHRFHEDGGRLFIVQLGTAWADRMRDLGVTGPSSPIDLRQSRANAIAGQLYDEFRAGDEASRLAIEGFSLAMLGEFTRARARAERSARPAWLLRATELLHASAGEGVHMADIAREVGVHPVHLARSFRAHHGATMGEYLRRLRVERARTQLLTTNAPLSRVALDAGFADQAHFTRVFRSLVGVPPGEYRRQASATPGRPG